MARFSLVTKKSNAELSAKYRQTEQECRAHSAQYIDFKNATLVYGKHKRTGKCGWFLPGGSFTERKIVASEWAEWLHYEIDLAKNGGSTVRVMP